MINVGLHPTKSVMLLLLAGISTSAWVQASSPTMDNLLELSIDQLLQLPITSASRYPETLVDTPATVMVITDVQIRERGYQNLLDLLADLPGFDVQRAVDATRYNWVTVSGLSGANRLLIFRDGVRVDSPTGDVIVLGQNFPLFSAKRVEVVFGPSAAVYGADAFGGVVNIITRDDQSRVSVHAGSANTSAMDLQIASRLDNGLSINVGGNLYRDELYEHVGDPARNASVDAIGFSGSVVIPASAREDYRAPVKSESAFMQLSYGAWELGTQYWQFQQQTNAGVRRQESLSNPDDINVTQFKNIYLRHNMDVTSHLHNTLLVDASRYEIMPETRFNNIFSNFQPAYKYLYGEKRSLENQLDFTLTDSHRIAGGIGREWFAAIPRTPDLTTPYDTDKAVNNQGQFYPNTDLPIQIYDLNYNNSFAYTQWAAQWNDQWSTTAGVRYDNSSRYKEAINPRLGVVYQPASDTVIKAMYGQGFRAPSATAESYVTFGSFSGSTDDDGNYLGTGFRVPSPNLQPEEIQAFELALLQQLSTDIDLTLRIFHYDTDRLIEVTSVSEPYQFIPGAILSNATTRANLGASEQNGVDLGLSGKEVLFENWIIKWWGFYSYVDGQAELNNIDRELPFIAHHKVKLGATCVYLDRYFVTTSMRWIDDTSSNLLKSNGADYREAPDYTLIDLHLGNIQSEKWSWDFAINNVFNTSYYHAVSDNSAGRGYADVSQPERTWIISLAHNL